MSPRAKKQALLPAPYCVSHDLCFVLHEVLVQLLVSGEASGVFVARIPLSGSSEADAMKAHSDIFEWLDNSGRVEDRAKILKMNRPGFAGGHFI